MTINELQKSVVELRAALGNAKSAGIDLNLSFNKAQIFDFSKSKEVYYRNSVKISMDKVKQKASAIANFASEDPDNGVFIDKVKKLVAEIEISEDKDKVLAEILDILPKIKVPETNELKKPSCIPVDIKMEVYADIDELQKTLNAGCYRSATILCGRILEVALHRKYYEVTEIDLLEKSPGIGLGKIVAKLSEKNVSFDPGLMQQIHLINNVRISSVHVKQESFNPNRAQAQAMILYTLDILEKIFKNKND